MIEKTAENNILTHLQFSQPTAEQVNALKAMQDFVDENNSDDVLILCGAAGTGKTSITNALVSYLNCLEKEYIIAAPTGRAARIISKKAKAKTSTIHSLIYLTHTDEKSGNVICTLKDTDYEKKHIFIIDESSMIPSAKTSQKSSFVTKASLLSDLITFIKGSHKENKVIFLGDTYQLPPVKETEANALNINYLKANHNLNGHVHYLTEVKRQENGSIILDAATNIRKDIDANKPSNQLAKFPIDSLDSIVNSYLKDALNNGYGSSQSIAQSHEYNAAFNHIVRIKQYGHNVPLLKAGDLLIIQENWRRGDAQLYNGDHVEVIEVNMYMVENVGGLNFVPIKLKTIGAQNIEIEDYIMIDCFTLNGGNVPFEKIRMLMADRMGKNPIFRASKNRLDDKYIGAIKAIYGHSITCHKAQGGEWSKVYLKSGWMPSLQWQYTAVTRASENLILYR